MAEMASLSRTHIDEDLKEQLEELSTCEISDALVKLGNPTGGFLPHLNIYSPSPIPNDGESGSGREQVKLVGRVFTVRLVEQEKPGAELSNGSKTDQHFVDAAPEGSVILISPDFVSGAACWGGLMSTAAKAKGIKGAVILGGCRDLVEHRQLGFPVFAQFHSTIGQKTFLRPSEYDIPLKIPILAQPTLAPRLGDVGHDQEDQGERQTVVEPWDVLVGDIDGVVIIPFERLREVIKLAKEGKAVDENIRKELELGRGVKETMKKWRGT
ncbi:uncharacterized protein I303_104384 [Kwoniella dejecticola CBS 10117]|uniref:RraA-like protein n=1 Tax=Kwoniella dejecticola CBS 10117 TaxID=1296121 RepID=A0A1A6A5H2_9TREE|nr:uncharacterized protein I303_04639 [Kwoniella dejecticola CBS 10117]OBR85304.1 hypothetical protein I303_04639 [Kwoniella dejecticola CBS 10117]